MPGRTGNGVEAAASAKRAKTSTAAMSLGTVLVTGCTGRVGKAAVAHLAKSGQCTVRAAVYTAAKADYMKSIGAHETVEFDLKRQETWGPALEGVSRVFSSSLDPLIAEHLEFAKFLGTKKDQIKHVVRISCFGADTNTNSYDKDCHVTVEGAAIPLMLQHYWWGEDCLVQAGLQVTVLRGNFYMNHLLKNEQDHIKDEGYFASPLGNTRNSFVCTNDMGEMAAKCFLEGPERHADKFYDVTGPAPQSMYEVAATLSKVIGKPVEYRPQDIEQFEKDFGKVRRDFFEYLRNGFYTRCSPDFYNVMGKKPTSYEQYLTQTGPFGETGVEELFSKAGAIFTKGQDLFKDANRIQKL